MMMMTHSTVYFMGRRVQLQWKSVPNQPLNKLWLFVIESIFNNYICWSLCVTCTHALSIFENSICRSFWRCWIQKFTPSVYTVSLERYSAIKLMFHALAHNCSHKCKVFIVECHCVYCATRWISGCPQPFTMTHLVVTYLYHYNTVSASNFAKNEMTMTMTMTMFVVCLNTSPCYCCINAMAFPTTLL